MEVAGKSISLPDRKLFWPDLHVITAHAAIITENAYYILRRPNSMGAN